MNTGYKKLKTTNIPPIFIVSGGAGASGLQVLHTVLVQFPEIQVPVVMVAHVRQLEQIEDVVSRAETTGGIIVHTMVDEHLRNHLNRLAADRNVPTIDLMGDLISGLTNVFGQKPIGHPGLYRQLNKAYFERVSAIEYAMAHDDGKNPQDWQMAEITLVGISRVGKTPLSMYLAVLGWKPANVPLIMGLTSPPELFEIDRRRVIGLTIEPGQIIPHRRQRQRRIGPPGPSKYTDPQTVYDQVKNAKKIFRKNGFSIIDVTDKPIETSAEQIIALITQRFKIKSHL